MRAAVPHEDSVGVSNVLKLSASWMRRVSGRFHRHQLDPAVSQKTTAFQDVGWYPAHGEPRPFLSLGPSTPASLGSETVKRCATTILTY